MIGVLCASEKWTSHSCCIACSTSSWMTYSLTSPFATHCTLKMLGLRGSFTVHLIRYHIRLLSSRLHFCFIAATCLCCFLDWASIRQSRRWTFRRSPVSVSWLFVCKWAEARPWVHPSSIDRDAQYVAAMQSVRCSPCSLLCPPSILLFEGTHGWDRNTSG